jgi:hypothetical protein
MSLLELLLTSASFGAVAALLASVVACILRQWRLAARLARVVALSGPVIFLVSVAVFVLVPLADGDPARKAVVLSSGVSSALNCGGLGILVALPASLLWVVAGRRIPRAG